MSFEGSFDALQRKGQTAEIRFAASGQKGWL
jgi:hypothetical protein